MLHHVSVGVRDVEHAAKFYDAVLGALGYKRLMEFLPYAIGYGEQHPQFWIQLPHNQQTATAGNGVHISFIARSRGEVDRFHDTAMELGAQNAGEPGPRPDYSPDYYGAFVYDFDGNKLEATLLPMPKQAKAAPKKTAPKIATKKTAKAGTKKTVKKAAKKPAPVKKAKKKAKRK